MEVTDGNYPDVTVHIHLRTPSAHTHIHTHTTHTHTYTHTQNIRTYPYTPTHLHTPFLDPGMLVFHRALPLCD
jgi:hypothetical protein